MTDRMTNAEIEALCEVLENELLDRWPYPDVVSPELGRKALTAIRQLQNPWMPIETAPRDGTEVLVWIRPKVIRLGWYFKRSSQTEGWCDENGKAIQPKYWRHLPPAPEASA